MAPSPDQQYPTISLVATLGALNAFEEKNAPETVYYPGNIGLLKNKSRVSVVGTRKPSPQGIQRARIVTRTLVEQNITVVSGLAEGVDTIAHQTALDLNGSTIAVLGTSLNNPYPKSNIALFERIARDHLVISQFPFNSPFQTKNFPIRNRTMALISHATIIIEAGEKSGTVHQGWEALRFGRSLYLLENLTRDASLSWPAEMIKYGAQVLTRDNFDQVFVALPPSDIDEQGFVF